MRGETVVGVEIDSQNLSKKRTVDEIKKLKIMYCIINSNIILVICEMIVVIILNRNLSSECKMKVIELGIRLCYNRVVWIVWDRTGLCHVNWHLPS